MKASAHLERRALWLGTANALDYGLQFLLPIVLARALDVDSFGKYRLLWLVVGTALALAPLAVPASLYYFLPRSDAAHKRLYINQTLLFLCATALVSAWVLSPLNPWQPHTLEHLAEPQWLVPLFTLLWIVCSLLDLLPTVDERVEWQAKAIIGLSGLRAVALSLAAIVTGELAPVLWTLVAFALFKLALLWIYVRSHHGWAGPIARRSEFAQQLKYAAPFGFSSALFGLRAQADQWVAASLFSIAQFASFSVATVIGPLVTICRQSVNNVFLTSMSRLEASGDVRGMLALNGRANVMVGALIYPVAAFVLLFAEDIVTAIYTDAYLDAAPVMRVYAFGMACLVVELNSVMLLLREGGFVLRNNFFLLVFSVPAAWLGATLFGLAGAAVGSVLAVVADRLRVVRRISARTGIPASAVQDWRSLALLVGISALSALLAWSAVHGRLDAFRPIARVAVTFPLMAVIYAALLAVVNGESRLVALRRRRARDAEV